MIRSLFIVAVVSVFIIGCTPTNESTSDTNRLYPESVEKALTRNTCLTCHRVDTKLVGPSYKDVAQRHTDPNEIVRLIKHPEPANWPDYPPMVGYPVSDADGLLIANWILSLKDSISE